MEKINGIIKKLIGSLMLPVIMYIVMYFLCTAKGVTYYGTWAMWRTMIPDIAISVACAFGIGLQFKSGRFDFSGGAIMLLAAIIAGNVAKTHNNNIALFIGLSIGVCVFLSLVVGIMYAYGRVRIQIATIGMALLYEAVTCLVYSGTGINLTANITLKKFSTFPGVLIPLAGVILVYAFFSYKSVSGKEAAVLSSNQQAAVNIGINERKSVLITYLYSGLIFGFATMIYASTGLHGASYSSLGTVGELFSNILPVFIGLMIGTFCGDTIGIILASIAICIMNFGLKAAFSAELGTAISTICVGAFMLIVNVAGAQAPIFMAWLSKKMSRKTA